MLPEEWSTLITQIIIIKAEDSEKYTNNMSDSCLMKLHHNHTATNQNNIEGDP